MTQPNTRSAQASKVLETGPLDPAEARWIRLGKITYTDPLGVKRVWETAERQTRPKNSTIDGVGIIAILDTTHGPEILLQKQFRPPINKVSIEVPAGLIDEGETPEQCAVRELKEETGYVGVVEKTSTVMFHGTFPSLSHIYVHDSNGENQNPVPELEENEFIECFTVPLATLYEETKRLEDEGYGIDARVGTLAEAIELGKRYRF
ncbi:MutT/nudix family protein [Talaromyces pinophilus]|uniref:MutT/nudix family protein n=1 Tax=Talaromyces pinophilus TaxID=128442 RepID=A0A510NV25_TALPI|nr:MutT/nudix family protein [Talaromyces pinophilus]